MAAPVSPHVPPPPPSLGRVASLLGKISAEREKGHKYYLCTNKDGKLVAAKESAIEREQLTRLPLVRVAQIAHEAVVNANSDDPLRAKHVLTISEALDKLSAERQESYNSMAGVAGRVGAAIVGAFLSFVGVGIILLKELHDASTHGETIKKFQADIQGRLSTVILPDRLPSAGGPTPEDENAARLIRDDLRAVSPIIVDQNDIDGIEKGFNAPSRGRLSPVQTFKNDFANLQTMSVGYNDIGSFHTNRLQCVVRNSNPEQSATIPRSRTEAIDNALGADKAQWRKPVQALVTDAAFDLLFSDLQDQARAMTKDQRVKINAGVELTRHPIQLTVERDPKTQKVTGVTFEVSGTLDLQAQNEAGTVAVKIPIVAASVKGRLSFNKDGQQVIEVGEPSYRLLQSS